MANKFVQYPYTIERADNGGYIVTSLTNSGSVGPGIPPAYAKYVFATQADLTYWIGFNELP
jgi:hypothetical protein